MYPFDRKLLDTLPMVLLHPGLTDYNLMVDQSCCLSGVTGWGVAYFGLFGVNLHTIDVLANDWDPERGLTAVPGRELLGDIFWNAFCEKANGNITAYTIRAIKQARVMGLLLACRSSLRLTNNHDYRFVDIALLDSLLINPATKFD